MAEHKILRTRNFVEDTIRSQCSCGWWIETRTDETDEIEPKITAHFVEVGKYSGVGVKPILATVETFPLSESQSDMVKILREIAADIEAGEVRDLVVVWDHRGEHKYKSNGFFDDRWRMLGAIEYAKKYVME